MAGHPLLSQTSSKTTTLDVAGRKYHVTLSYHNVPGLKGSAVGVKFSDATNSMDSSKKVSVSGLQLGKAIGRRVIEMTRNLKGVSFLGFYLLTDDIETERGSSAVRAKIRVYKYQAREIHNSVKHKLPQLTQVKVQGGVGWGMGEKNFLNAQHFQLFINELGKATEVINHAH